MTYSLPERSYREILRLEGHVVMLLNYTPSAGDIWKFNDDPLNYCDPDLECIRPATDDEYRRNVSMYTASEWSPPKWFVPPAWIFREVK